MFEYEINEQFFKEFEYSLVQKGSLKVALEFDKQETMLVLNFRIDGEVFQNCDVCLADFPTPLHLEQQEIVKFSNDELLEDNVDELIVLNKNENEIDELDGLTVSSQKWWFNLRPSNTEPLLRLNVEADSPKLMAEIRDTVLSLI